MTTTQTVSNVMAGTTAVEGLPQPAYRTEGPAARDRLVETHLPLVHRLVKRFSYSGQAVEDLVQVGCVGLVKAAEKFDPEREVAFVTYAAPVIVGEIKNYLRDHGWSVRVPRKLQQHRIAVRRTVDQLTNSLGRSPTIPEIARATEITEEEVYDTMDLAGIGRPLSLDAERGALDGETGATLLDFLGREDPEFQAASDRSDIAGALTRLGERERTIIYLRFYEGLPQTEVSKRLGISQMHVSRLQRRALSSLKGSLEGSDGV